MMRNTPWFERSAQDLRLTLHVALRSPGFALITVLLMALGVGATTTLFSLAYGVLFRPLRWPDAERIVRVQETRGGNAGRVPWTIANTTFHAWRERPATVEAIGGWTRPRNLTLAGGGSGTPETITIQGVTPSLFDVLRIRPVLGRVLEASDLESGGASSTIMLTYGTWQRRFSGRSDVIGTTIRVDDRLRTVVGVAPLGFEIPQSDAEAWIPLGVPVISPGSSSISAMLLNAVARLRPGVTPEQAAAEAMNRSRGAPSLRSAELALFGASGTIHIEAASIRESLTREVQPALLMLFGAVALLFTTAVASIVMLQSARAVRRRREMAVRAAIGASRAGLMRLWLTESLALGAAGGAAGLGLSAALHRLLPAILPPGFPRLNDVTVDVRVALFATVLTLMAAVACGIIPAWQSREARLAESLASDGLASPVFSGRSRGFRLRNALTLIQVAVACLLLVCTGLLARSFAALLDADRGFETRDVLTLHASAQRQPFASRAAALVRAQERLRSLPGVTEAAFANALPFVTYGGLSGTSLPSPRDPAVRIQAQMLTRVVSPEYFSAMGLRVIEGRPLRATDSAESRPVVVVNRTFASQYLGERQVGSILPVPFGSRREWEVVGVVDDVRQGSVRGVAPSIHGGVTDPPQPEVFFSYAQSDAEVTELAFVLRTSSDPMALAPALRAIVREEDPTLIIESVMTMEDRLLESLARPRIYAMLVGGFALFAAAIALAGLVGVLSHLAGQRRREIGVRSALGATPLDIVRLVTREAVVMTSAGVAAGLGMGYAATRWLSSMLYGVMPNDAVTFASVAAVLIMAAAIACAVPAQRATRVSPLVAMRPGG